MDPAAPPKLFGEALGSALIKSRPDDFQVEEILGFRPSGVGEHCFVWVEKADRNSNDVASHLAARLGIRKRLVSHCGLKDRHAVTRQWFSLHLPGQASPATADLEGDGVRALKITRNERKLRRGSHDGNRFKIRLRGCAFSDAAAATRWQMIATRGVPNYFGPQRFGRDGNNVSQALRFLAGEVEVRDRALRGILISAARSYLFNACVAERVGRGDWDTTLDGEVFGFASNRSLVLPDNLHGDEAARVAGGALELTAPLWGVGELQSLGAVRALEMAVVERHVNITRGLEAFRLRQERRVMRLRPCNPTLTREPSGDLIASFDLPKGTYATTVLREMVEFD